MFILKISYINVHRYIFFFYMRLLSFIVKCISFILCKLMYSYSIFVFFADSPSSAPQEKSRMLDITRDKPIKVAVRVAVPVKDHPKVSQNEKQ